MKFLDYLWGIFWVGLIAYIAVFGLLSIYEDHRWSVDVTTPQDKKIIAKQISGFSWKAAGIAVIVFVIIKYFSAP